MQESGADGSRFIKRRQSRKFTEEALILSKFFTSRKIFDNVTQIGGLGGELCYLIEGSEKALLIDGLTGVGSLKAFVRECTDLPVTLVLTHGHVDHAGASFEYGECYVNPADVALLYEHGDIDKRYGFVMGGGKPEGAFGAQKGRRCAAVRSEDAACSRRRRVRPRRRAD